MNYSQIPINYLIWKYLKENKFYSSLHSFEEETKIHFNIKYFLELVIEGRFDEAESYFTLFTQTNDQKTIGIIYCLRKNYYLHLLETSPSLAQCFLQEKMDVFKTITEMNYLKQLKTWKEYTPCSFYETTKDYREQTVSFELRKMIELHDKMEKGISINENDPISLENIILYENV